MKKLVSYSSLSIALILLNACKDNKKKSTFKSNATQEDINVKKEGLSEQKGQINSNEFGASHHMKALMEDSLPTPQLGSGEAYETLRYMTAFVNEFEGETLLFIMSKEVKWPPKFVTGGAAARGEAKLNLNVTQLDITAANWKENLSRYKNKKDLIRLAGDFLDTRGGADSKKNKWKEIQERFFKIIDREGTVDARKLCVHYYANNKLLVKLMYQRAVKYIDNFPQ